MTAPAQAAFLRHAGRWCRYGGDLTRCQVCRDLDRDASAEAWRRAQRVAVVGAS